MYGAIAYMRRSHVGAIACGLGINYRCVRRAIACGLGINYRWVRGAIALRAHASLRERMGPGHGESQIRGDEPRIC